MGHMARTDAIKLTLLTKSENFRTMEGGISGHICMPIQISKTYIHKTTSKTTKIYVQVKY